MPFSIRISNKTASPDISNPDEKGMWGEIEIGNFKEDIIVPTYFWSKSDYINQWHAAINALLDRDKEKAALITGMYDPKHADYINCWPLYREGEVVYVHNQLLFLNDLSVPGSFDLKKLKEYISDREATDAGNQISEWKTSVTEMRKWLDELLREL